MILRSTIQLLRFHFSVFLLPVFLFALSEADQINMTRAVLVFLVLHLLVYPSSNGYNSYMDRDQTPIGGLSQPMQPTRQLFFASVLMDITAVVLSLFINRTFALGILLYIAASRAYSYRGIRLKKYPFIGFLTVFIFQGAAIFYITCLTVQEGTDSVVPFLPCIISSCLIGALYPLTQVYQHEEDRADGVTTISMVLGKRGSFIFSMILFLSATFLLYIRYSRMGHTDHFLLFLLVMFPVVLYFLFWMRKVWRDAHLADFSHSMRMNVLATVCTSVIFITLTILKH